MSSFGNLLKKLRHEAGLSQEQLAGKMNVSKNTIQNWEKGTTKVNYDRFPLLADIFNTPVELLIGEFYREEGEKRPNNWPSFLFDDDINEIIETLHLNRNQQDLFGLLYIYNAEYLQKDRIDFNTIYDDPNRYEVDNYFKLGILMKRAKVILPILEKGAIHITDKQWANKVRKDIPRELIETLEISLPYELWLEKYDDLKENDYGNWGGCMNKGLKTVTTYHNIAPEGQPEEWYLEINEKGRSLLKWFIEKE